MKSPKKSSLKRVLVTGGTGKLGSVCVADLQAHGYDVFVVDTVPPEKGIPHIIANLSDFGQTLDALSSTGHEIHAGVGPQAFDAIVHLAAFPTPASTPMPTCFRTTSWVPTTCLRRGGGWVFTTSSGPAAKPRWASPSTAPSPTRPWTRDEDYPLRAKSAYALAKVLMEDMARQFCLQTPDMKLVGLRFSNVMEPQDYAKFPAYDPEERKWNMWAYIDARDGAQAIRKAIEWEATGMHPFIIANADTVMSKSSAELMKNFLPQVPVRKELGEHETLLSIEKARKVLGYEPEFSWRDKQSR